MVIGKKKGDKTSGIDVNLAAFKDIKTRADLKKEPGQIFAHLSAADQDAAYEELANALNLPKTDSKPTAAAGVAATTGTTSEPAK